MFTVRRSHTQAESFGKYRATKSTVKSRRSFRDQATSRSKVERAVKAYAEPPTSPVESTSSPVVNLVVGPEGRIFACHESVLRHSPYFDSICREQYMAMGNKRVDLPDEIPEIFSAILEFLYKGDYTPRLAYDKKRGSWQLDSDGQTPLEATVYHPSTGMSALKDTVIYCSADRYGLDELKRLALRKQGLQHGVQCSTILTSARFAYLHTPDSDSKLRAHYLALIIRSRATFKRSGTMQMEMEAGGKMFFDLFVAMVNHLDDVSTITAKSTR